VIVIPNCLDTERWKPMEQTLARELMGLPADVPLLLFGAMGGGRDPSSLAIARRAQPDAAIQRRRRLEATWIATALSASR
jgi:hypothetical protein